MIISPSDIKTVLIAGAGAMGQQIGMLFSQYGRRVVIYDLSREVLDAANVHINTLLTGAVDSGRIDSQTRAAILARISYETDLEKAACDADLVSESVPEDPDLKGTLFGQLNQYCPGHTVFTTNTSTLVPSQFASATGRPEKFSALHFHYPTDSNRVVDIMPHPGTDAAVVGLLMALMTEMQMIPIYLAREKSSYVFNTLLTALNDAAVSLVADGYASIEDVDRSWMGVMHSPVGPFGIMDAVSLATLYKINKDWAERTQHPRAMRHVAFLQPYIDAGKLGTNSGEGFYKYPDPSFARPDFLVGGNKDA